MKKENKSRIRGFTLAELLIVVAIIAILTAVAIPVFSSTLELAREATDLANIRSEYASAVVAAMDSEAGVTRTVVLQQKKNGWETKNEKVVIADHYIIEWFPDIDVQKSVVITVDVNGKPNLSQD